MHQTQCPQCGSEWEVEGELSWNAIFLECKDCGTEWQERTCPLCRGILMCRVKTIQENDVRLASLERCSSCQAVRSQYTCGNCSRHQEVMLPRLVNLPGSPCGVRIVDRCDSSS